MAPWPLGRAFYAWDRISGAGVGALVFTAPSAVLESYLILHRLKPVLLKTVGVKVGPVALGPGILRLGSNRPRPTAMNWPDKELNPRLSNLAPMRLLFSVTAKGRPEERLRQRLRVAVPQKSNFKPN